MAFLRKEFFLKDKIKAYKFLLDEFNCTMKEAQKWIDKKRVFVDGQVMMTKSKNICGKVEVIVFDPKPSGLYPVFEVEDFAVFEKPSGILVHPNNFSDTYSLNDDIKSLFGKDANVVHRIDKETSGLIMVSKNKKAEVEIKRMFENREIKKEYIALVRGKIENDLSIDTCVKANLESSKIRIKSFVVESGFRSITHVSPLLYIKELDLTLVKAIPITGRTHQIRVHLFHVKHSILGDPIYGVNEDIAEKYLNGYLSDEERIKNSGSLRLMLHSHLLSFNYKNIDYNIKSKIKLGGYEYE
ncbi:MAG: RluA family pseudouridine synthase [Sulfurospirillaceae bacterium]|nr:RluA family pseudouridine synthase [Sulfurospirillaceae bacterium]